MCGQGRQAGSTTPFPRTLRERIVISPGVNSGRAPVSHPSELSRLGVADENLGAERIGSRRLADEERKEKRFA